MSSFTLRGLNLSIYGPVLAKPLKSSTFTKVVAMWADFLTLNIKELSQGFKPDAFSIDTLHAAAFFHDGK